MLATLLNSPSDVTLIENSGIQCLDFGLIPRWQATRAGRFVRQTANGPLLRVNDDEVPGKFMLPSRKGAAPEMVKPEITLSLIHSLQVLDNQWVGIFINA